MNTPSTPIQIRDVRLEVERAGGEELGRVRRRRRTGQRRRCSRVAGEEDWPRVAAAPCRVGRGPRAIVPCAYAEERIGRRSTGARRRHQIPAPPLEPAACRRSCHRRRRFPLLPCAAELEGWGRGGGGRLELSCVRQGSLNRVYICISTTSFILGFCPYKL